MEHPILTYNSHGSMIALGVSLVVLATVAMGIRAASHLKHFNGVQVGDLFIMAAYILVLGLGITVIAASSLHIIGSQALPKMSTPEFQKINQLEYGFWIAYVITVGFIKLSILFFFRRLFKGRFCRTAFDYVNWTLVGLTTAWTITFTLACIFLCGSDPSALWSTDFWVESKCVNTYALFLSCSISNFFVDLAILIEPLVVVSKLTMAPKKKIQATVVLLLSGFAVIAGLMRMIFWIQSNIGKRNKLVYHEIGLTYPISDLEPLVTICIFWTFMEVGVGFLVACLLPSARLFDAFFNNPVMHKLVSQVTRLRQSQDLRPERLSPVNLTQGYGASTAEHFSDRSQQIRRGQVSR